MFCLCNFKQGHLTKQVGKIKFSSYTQLYVLYTIYPGIYSTDELGCLKLFLFPPPPKDDHACIPPLTGTFNFKKNHYKYVHSKKNKNTFENINEFINFYDFEQFVNEDIDLENFLVK